MKAVDQVMAWLGTRAARRISPPVLQHTEFEVFSDSDHVGDRSLGLRSQTGVVILCNGAPVHWRSNKQPSTSISSAAAEVNALAEAARDARHCTDGD